MGEEKSKNQISIFTVLEEDHPDDEIAQFTSKPFLTLAEAKENMEKCIKIFLDDFATPEQEIERGESFFIWRKAPLSADTHEVYLQETKIEVDSHFFSKIASEMEMKPIAKSTWPHTPDAGEILNSLESLESAGRSNCTVKELLEEARRKK
jgi:hypothetical protein